MSIGGGNYIGIKFDCPAGTGYDEDLGICNTKDKVDNCRPPQPDTTAGPMSPGEEACSTMLTSPDDHLAPDKTDCHNYYICVQDGTGGYIAYERRCQDGLAFDDPNNKYKNNFLKAKEITLQKANYKIKS